MKKFILSVLTATVTVSAFATGFQSFDVPQSESRLSSSATRVIPDPENTLKIKVNNMNNMNVFTRDQGPSDFEGDWTFTFGDYYMEGTDGPIDVTYTAQYDPQLDIYVFLSSHPQGLPMAAFYLADKEAFMFVTVNWGYQGGYYAFQRPFHYNAATNTLEYQDIYGYYDPSTGVMSFDPEEGISWEAFEDEAGSTFAGWYALFDFLSATNMSAGVEGIEADTMIAPVYYDILGNKVKNPRKGQIIIEKIGNKSRKILF